ncbi:ribosomal protein L14 [Cardiosporidium cionae]|uniref:Ribosomal protein L14 n=1 Tax=Cardiosporidium cionae TaxID=476202 RepID=A0ABQ7J5Z7_9APIC|nr:ribosomal protein L14 [Cardiosporidium cionae]|eukprot:KAF8819417.1 ribosomal protein L14 [Cardiosporidium cionae]
MIKKFLLKLKTRNKSLILSKTFLHKTIYIYNGKEYIPIFVTQRKLGYSLAHMSFKTVFNLLLNNMIINYPTSYTIRGLKVQLAGRINGAEMAKKEVLKYGVVPLQSISNNIYYRNTTLSTKFGSLVNLNKIITSKPSDSRMGSGKGGNHQNVCLVKAGAILFEIKTTGSFFMVSDNTDNAVVLVDHNLNPLGSRILGSIPKSFKEKNYLKLTSIASECFMSHLKRFLNLKGLLLLTTSQGLVSISLAYKLGLGGCLKQFINNYSYQNKFYKELTISGLGYSHKIKFKIPSNVSYIIRADGLSLQLYSTNKILLGLIASQLKQIKKIECYKGKGIRYSYEQIKLKSNYDGWFGFGLGKDLNFNTALMKAYKNSLKHIFIIPRNFSHNFITKNPDVNYQSDFSEYFNHNCNSFFNLINNNLKLEFNLQKKYKFDIKTKKGLRFKHHLPVRGQKTKTNAKTASKLNII